MRGQELIEGYAAVFGAPDLVGDVVRAGAFSASIARGQSIPMLLQHKQGAVVGRWSVIRETGEGLYVRGLVESDRLGPLLQRGMDGLSIGFRPTHWKPRHKGRELVGVDLVEISLVTRPMQPLARFNRVSGRRLAA